MLIPLPRSEAFFQDLDWPHWQGLFEWSLNYPDMDVMTGFLEQLQNHLAFRQRFVRFLETATQWEQDKAAYVLQQSQENHSPFDTSNQADTYWISVSKPDFIRFNETFGNWQGLKTFVQDGTFQNLSDFIDQLENQTELRQEIVGFLTDARRFEGHLGGLA